MYDVELSFKTIGGTDISVLTGTNKYQSPFELLENKRLKRETSVNMKMCMGIILEDFVADVYAYNKGITLDGKDDGSIVLEDMYRATIDRVYTVGSTSRIVDIKTRWGFWKGFNLPRSYADQVNFYTGIYDELGLFDGNFPGDPLIVTMYQGDLYECTVPYNHVYYQQQKDIAREFYPYIFNKEILPFDSIFKWMTVGSFYNKLYEDLICRKISGVVVERSLLPSLQPQQKALSILDAS
jgi:hypothetical protein